MTPATISAVSVVVPAQNEEDLIGRCLDGIDAAARHLRDECGSTLSLDVVVVLDACTDGTAAIAREHRVRTVVVDRGTAGVARRAGVRAALQTAPSPSTLWIANTDADSVVPEGWLTTHVRLADAGADLVVGLVQPEDSELSPGQRRRWRRAHPRTRNHRHVFGANLGIRGSTYEVVGGFAAVAVGEDRALVDAARRTRARVVTTDQGVVVTSSRRDARAPAGFAAWLHAT